MSFDLSDINLFLLVFMRMSGTILFNPIFGKKNVPVILKAGLSLICALLVTSSLVSMTVKINGVIQLAVCGVLELLIGYALGVVIDSLFSVVMIAGEQIDWQMGLSMANIYDPNQNLSMPVFGSFLNLLLMLVFFASNSHLALLCLVTDSFKAIPPGTFFPTADSFQYIVKLMGDVFALALRMALPFIAVEIIVQISLGILMKAVPQINVFTVGIQLEAIAGIVMMLIMIPIMVALCGRLSDFIIEKCSEVLKLMMQT